MKILITAFRNTSAQKLISCHLADTLIIENDKAICAAQIENAVKQGTYDIIFCFGQRPNIKDKVHIETQAQMRDSVFKTAFDCEALCRAFEQNSIASKLSHNAGTSYCNHLYYSGLSASENTKTQIVFVHIPFEKNISDFDEFAMKIIKTVNEWRG